MATVAHADDYRLHAILKSNPDQGWRAFIEAHTPTLLAFIERAGVRDRDEAMDLYVLVCQRLAENNYARLRRHNPAQGALAAWLAVVVRNTAVDWVRTRAGRRRLFASIKQLGERDQRVFELYYWDEQTPVAIAEALTMRQGAAVSVGDVLDALQRIDAALTPRHRRELLALAARTQPPSSITQEDGQDLEVASADPDPQDRLERGEAQAAFDTALRALPSEEAAIVRLRFIQGLSTRDVQRALHIPKLTDERIRQIVEKLKAVLMAAEDCGGAAPARAAGHA
jgi:DNA-directed RNA polymerase specialized sigma24 family protein